ncbi:hypothetical protein C6P42_001645 [Pichia californica]|nr:hypothetical protein C6P42_001645 [[Candida] californica]
MFRISHIFTYILLLIYYAHADLNNYTLIIHNLSETPLNGYRLAEVTVDSTTRQARIEELNKPDIDQQTYPGWCLSFLSLENSLNDDLWCFNYFKSLPDYSGNLFITVDNDSTHIISSNYIPNKEGTRISLKIENSYSIPNPQPRLRLGGPVDPTINPQSSDSEELESKEKERKREEYKKNKQEQKDAGQEVRNQIIDDEMMKDFQEVVKPKGIYSDNKTFIEKYWMYIIPPVLAFFILGNLGAEAQR